MSLEQKIVLPTCTMELLTVSEINSIVKQCGQFNILKWSLEEFSEKILGYLGDHLKLIIEVEDGGIKSKLKLFVKCLPRFDKWKSEYLKELKFFYKEFVMLSKLFREFQNGEGNESWRPNLLFIREDLFVFEDVTQLGYKMYHHQDTMSLDALKATIKILARFHAQSYIYKERKSKETGNTYRIWNDFSEFLQEPIGGLDWRDTGRNAVMDYLKVFSKYKSNVDFVEKIDNILPTLFKKAYELMKPSMEYRNVVVHRDLWTNNILIKEVDGELHALIVDFQTVLYASPLLDLSSLIYFNTSRLCRDSFSRKLINTYYDTLSAILQESGLDIDTILPKDTILKAYDESLIFGMTQASIIVPIVSMSSEKREEIFCDPEKSVKANVVSRSEEFIEIAHADPVYRSRVSELLDEIVEKYVYPIENNGTTSKN